MDEFIRGLKSDGLWDAILDMGVMAGADNFNGVLVKVKAAPGSPRVLTNSNFVSGDYTPAGANAGLLGNGVNKRLNTGNITISTQTSFSLGFYGMSMPTTGTSMFISDFQNTVRDGTLHGGSSFIFNTGTPTGAIVSGTTSSNGFIVGSRTTGSEARLFRNGSQIGINNGTPSTFSGVFAPSIFARSDGSFFSTALGRLYFVGTGLSAAQVSSLSTRVNDLMRSIGANVY
jgi:hypothetical protein